MSDPKPRPVKVTIGIRHTGVMHTQTAVSLAECYGYTGVKYVREGLIELGIFAVGGCMLPDTTEAVAAYALDAGSDYVLWIDSDMTFPPDALECLLLASQQAHAPIVGAGYPQRRRPAKPTAMGLDGKWLYLDDLTPDEHGLVDVDFMGMGVLLTHTDVFRGLPRPWFPFTYDHKNNRWGGEDVYLMRKAREVCGIPAKMHLGLSRRVGHIGTHVFTHADSEADREREAETCLDGVMPHQKALPNVD